MALNYEECEAYFRGEIRPLIFEVYTESGIPFTLTNDPKDKEGLRAFCEVKDEQGNLLSTLPATVILDEDCKKQFICSWNTDENLYPVGYYRLQVWALVNVSGAVDQNGDLVIEGKLASDELIRYLKT